MAILAARSWLVISPVLASRGGSAGRGTNAVLACTTPCQGHSSASIARVTGSLSGTALVPRVIPCRRQTVLWTREDRVHQRPSNASFIRGANSSEARALMWLMSA